MIKLKSVSANFDLTSNMTNADLVNRLKEYPDEATLFVEVDDEDNSSTVWVSYNRPFTAEELRIEHLQKEANTKIDLERRRKTYEKLKEEFE